MNIYTSMPNPKNTGNKISRKLEEEIRRSILLTGKEKKYWIDLIPSMPKVMAEMVFRMVKGKNAVTDRYIEAALERGAGKDFQEKLKARVEKIKKRAREMDEAAEQGKNEEILTELSDV
jgi:hypothetical protein